METIINSLGEVIIGDDCLNRAEIRALDKAQRSQIAKVWAIQRAVTNGRFRAWLGRDKYIGLCTEFIYFSDDKETKKKVENISKMLGAKLFVLMESPHSDKVTYNYGTAAENTVIGENHGRMETQVELSWRVDSAKEARKIRKIAKKGTEEIWKTNGVCVI